MIDERTMIHRCEAPIRVEIEAGIWRYLTVDGRLMISRCPRCGRRLLRSGLRAVGGGSVRGGDGRRG